jgi:malonyl-CoA O-methyltransferase
MSIRKAYDRWATTYDTDLNLTRDLDGLVARQVLKDFDCDRVLEVGCGTGKNTPFLAQISRHVLALDFSPGMLRKAREGVRLDSVSLVMADLTRPWPCRERSVELVACDLVLEHIEDLAFVFSEAAHSLVEGGRFFVCELHPYWQYQGAQAAFRRGEEKIEIPAFVHHISSYLDAAHLAGLALKRLQEWWHPEDQNRHPRLVSFIFEKRRGG